MFKELIADHWNILTYRKGKTRKVPLRAFQERSAKIDGREVTHKLAEKSVQFLDGTLTLRQITVLAEDGAQTNIITSDNDAIPIELAFRMFNRWRQENFFKYMKVEFDLDKLVQYGDEPADSQRMVPNPRWKAIDKQLKAARAALAAIEREYGAAAFDNKEGKRRTIRGFKIANGRTIGKPLREARAKVQAIERRRRKIPRRVLISKALKHEPVRLRTEAKRLTDVLKTVAYQTETALVDLLRPHYARTEEDGRAFIAAALQSAAELSLKDGVLHVTIAEQSSPHRTRALQGVCRDLNKMGACFPGSNLRLRFEVTSADVPEQPTEAAGHAAV